MEYVGHIISAEGVSTNPTKTVAMLQWPTPTNVTELRGILGLTGFYRKSVKYYGIIAKPLTTLLHKKSFVWFSEAQAAFDKLKQAMSSTPVLRLPDFTKPFALDTDACAVGIGAVLIQEGHPIAFYSKALGPVNQKLSIYEKEFLAILMAVDKRCSYLQRGPFTIYTDHKILCNLEDQVLSSDLQKKAMTKLFGLQYKFQYKKGVNNIVAYTLSRVGNLFHIQAISVAQPVWLQEVLNSNVIDTHAQQLLAQLAVNSPSP